MPGPPPPPRKSQAPGGAPCSLGITAACTGTTDSDKAWQHFVRHAVLKLAQNSNYTNYINDIEGGPPPEGGARSYGVPGADPIGHSWTQLDAVGHVCVVPCSTCMYSTLMHM
eukprot:gene19097-biopygen17469